MLEKLKVELERVLLSHLKLLIESEPTHREAIIKRKGAATKYLPKKIAIYNFSSLKNNICA